MGLCGHTETGTSAANKATKGTSDLLVAFNALAQDDTIVRGSMDLS